MREQRGDQGASLVIVLAFLAVFGVLVVLLLGQTTTSFGRTLVSRTYNEKSFAADAGVDAAITRLRADDTLCPKAGATGALTPLSVNSKTVTVTCRTISGSSAGAGGYALITTDPGGSSFDTQSGGGGEKRIIGSVYSSGFTNSVDVFVKNGFVREFNGAGGCSSNSDRP